MLQTPAISAWESVLRIQAMFWKGLADYANSRGAADRRQRVLVEQALNASHVLKLASRGQDTREDWLPMRNAAAMRPSAKFVVEVLALPELHLAPAVSASLSITRPHPHSTPPVDPRERPHTQPDLVDVARQLHNPASTGSQVPATHAL